MDKLSCCVSAWKWCGELVLCSRSKQVIKPSESFPDLVLHDMMDHCVGYNEDTERGEDWDCHRGWRWDWTGYIDLSLSPHSQNTDTERQQVICWKIKGRADEGTWNTRYVLTVIKEQLTFFRHYANRIKYMIYLLYVVKARSEVVYSETFRANLFFKKDSVPS